MLTNLGKELRKLRIDREERLLDMAERLEKSVSYISAVEIGKKSPANNFEELVIKAYQLTGEAATCLRRAADASRNTFSLQPNSALRRDTAGLFARRMNGLSDEELIGIKRILEKKIEDE